MKNKTTKKRRGFVGGGVILTLIAIVLLGLFLNYNLERKNKNLQQWDRYAIIGKKNIILVYEDKLSVKIPYEIQLDKETTIKNLEDSKNYKLLLDSLNEFLPEKVNNYKVIKYNEVPTNTKNSRNIPDIEIEDKRYILTSGMKELFLDLYGGELKTQRNLVVDILNANGIGGYARRTGENLKKNLSMNYTAANFEKNTEYSYIKINEINKEDVTNILENVNEKYFKIKEDSDIPTLASVVLILGKENSINFKIEVEGGSPETEKVLKELKESGYKNVVLKKGSKKLEKSIIEYNKEDYYTALKIAKKLNITDMIENNSLNNKIDIFIK